MRVALLLPLLLLAVTGFAQDGIKKSKKTETIEGKKYYIHTVEKGQTLYAIAKAYDLTVNDILLENPDAMNGIKPGQTLRIPFDKKASITTVLPADTSKRFIFHNVETGQTMYSISKQYNVAQDTIYKYNPEARAGLKVGMKLKIPDHTVRTTTAAPAGATDPAKKFTVHTVEAGHTIYSIAKQFNTAPDSIYKYNPEARTGLKIGMKLWIPDPNGTAIFGQRDSVVVNLKEVYNVAFMMPLQLWNVANIEADDVIDDKAEFPQKPKAAVEFYEGALLAIDSMRKTGMRVNVWVYDVDDLDSGKTGAILAKPEFANMDLIIGPFSPGPFDEVAEFANAHHIGIVSPVSSANRVLFKNPMAMKSVPSAGTQMEQLAQHIYKERKEENVVLITSGLLKEHRVSASFRDEINRLRTADGKDSIRVNQGFSGIESKLQKDKMNVLVIPSTSQAFVTDLLRNLYGLADKYQITVYGMPAWTDYDNLDYEYLEALHFHFAAPYYVNYDAPGVKRFVLLYRNVYGGDPTTFSFSGYDNTMFFLQQLKTTGAGFVPGVSGQKGEGLQQTFSFARPDAESGYENIGLRIVHISDYELVPFGFENPKKDKK